MSRVTAAEPGLRPPPINTLTCAEGFRPVRRSAEPTVVHLPNLLRDVDLMAPELRAVVNKLVTGRARWPLYLHGTVGVGKTRGMLCLCDHVPGSAYTTVADLCDRRLGAVKGELWDSAGYRVWESGIWSAWAAAPFVVLDELGMRDNVSDFHFETVKKAIDLRENQPAAFISNLDLAGIARVYDDRIASRLASGTVFKLTGSDRRLSRPGGELEAV